MKTARIQVLIGFFLTVSIVVIYKMVASELVDPSLRQARLAYQIEKLETERAQLQRVDDLEIERFQVKRAGLRRENDLTFYGVVGLLSAGGVSLMILALGFSRVKVKRAAIYIARIGQHSEIPIHEKDLPNFYPIAVNLSLAEIEASVSTAHDTAYRISRQMLDDITEYTRTLAGTRGRLAAVPGHPAALSQFETPVLTATPTFAELLRKGTIAPGQPLVVGYDRQGQPHARALPDLKSVAVAGWQGSGKTLSMGYLVAASVLAAGVQVYVVDPHKHHPESLATLLQPLERTGQVTLVNPFDTPALLADLNHTLDRRLAGEEASEPGILLVIDELARLAKMDCFTVLVAFLERCTEETRKANMTFIGGSPKWTARHFKGRADIRGCMNSMLIHKTKPSQAELLLEDAHEKHLVKQLLRPGDAILATDYAAPTVVSIPLCTRHDMETVAELISATRNTETGNGARQDQPAQPQTVAVRGELVEPPLKRSPSTGSGRTESKQETVSPTSVTAEIARSEKRASASEVISLAQHRKESAHARQTTFNPDQLTVELLNAQLQRRKAQEATLTQAEVARQAGLSQSYLSRILNGQYPLSDKHKHKLYEILFDNKHGGMLDKSLSSFRQFGFKKAVTR